MELVDSDDKENALTEKIRTEVTFAIDEHIAEEKSLLRRRDEIQRKINNLLLLAEDGQLDDILRNRIIELKETLSNVKRQLEDIEIKRKGVSFDFSQITTLR